MIALLAVAPSHQSASYVFTHFNMPGQQPILVLPTNLHAAQNAAGCSSYLRIDALCYVALFALFLVMYHLTELPLLFLLSTAPFPPVGPHLPPPTCWPPLPPNPPADVGIANSGLIFLLGLLMSQFTLTGYDASAHMTEETKDAAKSGPRGIILTVGVSFVVGWMYLLSLTFSIQVRARVRAWCPCWRHPAARSFCSVRSTHVQQHL